MNFFIAQFIVSIQEYNQIKPIKYLNMHPLRLGMKEQDNACLLKFKVKLCIHSCELLKKFMVILSWNMDIC